MLTIGGIVLAILAIVAATVMDGNSFGALIGPSSLLLVFVGAIGASMTAYDLKDFKNAPKAAIYALTGKILDSNELVNTLMSFAEIARREGVLALEAKLKEIEEPFLQIGLQQVVDGLDADAVQEVLDIELQSLEERHQTQIGIFKALGGYAPTMGMIGTVIGLINMLGNLSDPSQLGLGLSVALLTTLYGVLFANLIFLPIGTRLDRLHQVEITAKEMAMDGILAVQGGASPRMLVERLEAHLPHSQRLGHKERQGATKQAA